MMSYLMNIPVILLLYSIFPLGLQKVGRVIYFLFGKTVACQDIDRIRRIIKRGYGCELII